MSLIIKGLNISDFYNFRPYERVESNYGDIVVVKKYINNNGRKVYIDTLNRAWLEYELKKYGE